MIKLKNLILEATTHMVYDKPLPPNYTGTIEIPAKNGYPVTYYYVANGMITHGYDDEHKEWSQFSKPKKAMSTDETNQKSNVVDKSIIDFETRKPASSEQPKFPISNEDYKKVMDYYLSVTKKYTDHKADQGPIDNSKYFEDMQNVRRMLEKYKLTGSKLDKDVYDLTQTLDPARQSQKKSASEIKRKNEFLKSLSDFDKLDVNWTPEERKKNRDEMIKNYKDMESSIRKHQGRTFDEKDLDQDVKDAIDVGNKKISSMKPGERPTAVGKTNIHNWSKMTPEEQKKSKEQMMQRMQGK